MELTSICVQVHGGMGYVEETGVAQYFRDSRIAPIYEGTNGIQAVDLVARKVPMRGGGVVKDLLARMEELDGDLAAAGSELAGVRAGLAHGVRVLGEATEWIIARAPSDPKDVLAGASPYLRMFGTVIGCWLLARARARCLAAVGRDGGVRCVIPAGQDRHGALLRRAIASPNRRPVAGGHRRGRSPLPG